MSRPAEAVRGAASVVVGVVPATGSALANASAARTLEQVLAPLAAGEGSLLGALGFRPELAPGAAPDLAVLVRAVQGREVRISNT